MSIADPAILARAISRGGVDILRPRLHSEAPLLPIHPTISEFDLNPQDRPRDQVPLTQAAVLLPLILREQPLVLLTERTRTLSRHAGQVAFPGGRAEPGDISLVETALRETQEETGIEPSFITIAGYLDAYETGTGFAILPVVGLLADGFALAPDAAEVASVFEVPLQFLLDPINRVKQTRELNGRRRTFFSYTYDGHYIWGATAAMLINFADRVSGL